MKFTLQGQSIVLTNRCYQHSSNCETIKTVAFVEAEECAWSLWSGFSCNSGKICFSSVSLCKTRFGEDARSKEMHLQWMPAASSSEIMNASY